MKRQKYEVCHTFGAGREVSQASLSLRIEGVRRDIFRDKFPRRDLFFVLAPIRGASDRCCGAATTPIRLRRDRRRSRSHPSRNISQKTIEFREYE